MRIEVRNLMKNVGDFTALRRKGLAFLMILVDEAMSVFRKQVRFV